MLLIVMTSTVSNLEYADTLIANYDLDNDSTVYRCVPHMHIYIHTYVCMFLCACVCCIVGIID